MKKRVNNIGKLILGLMLIFSASCDKANTDFEILIPLFEQSKEYALNPERIEYDLDISADISLLMANSIESVVDKGFNLESFLAKDEIKYLTSSEVIKSLNSQKQGGLQEIWKSDIAEEMGIRILDSTPQPNSDSKYLSVSSPLISTNKEFALLLVVRTSGIDVASGDVVLLKNIEGKWTLLFSMNQWSS